MKSTSDAVARGSMVSRAGASVVPAITAPSHGRRNTTRPSLVLGTIKPCASGLSPRSVSTGHSKRQGCDDAPKICRQRDMDSRAWGDHGSCSLVSEPAGGAEQLASHCKTLQYSHALSHGVTEWASGVDDNARIHRKLLTRQLVAAHRAANAALGVLRCIERRQRVQLQRARRMQCDLPWSRIPQTRGWPSLRRPSLR